MNVSTELSNRPSAVLDLRPGELVRVRSAAEIFATLDAEGTLDGLPFMPEMIKYCGRTLSVGQRADATCAGDGVLRRMRDAVHLTNIRCDGSAHGGCQAACLMYWKEAWLERVDNGARRNGAAQRPQALDDEEESFVADTLVPATRAAGDDASEPVYSCQATEIPKASQHVRFREVDQYARAIRNWRPAKIVRGLVIQLFNFVQSVTYRRFPERLRIARGREYPFVVGSLNKGETPKSGQLDLRAGDLVRIKSKAEIVATLDKTNHHRGLSFDGEMANYCGRTARVRARVNHIIDEATGKMIHIKSDCIILDGVVCTGDYHRFCTRAIYSYWREIWLEKIESPDDMPTAPCVNRWSRA